MTTSVSFRLSGRHVDHPVHLTVVFPVSPVVGIAEVVDEIANLSDAVDR
jgi:hypothetical protein